MGFYAACYNSSFHNKLLFMSNSYFQFKQFTIHHDRCAMKVGTDGVLLGAWAPLIQPRHILDIGTGSGLIALMLAQRYPQAQVTGIDIDTASIEQAAANVAASPFAERVAVKCQALQALQDATASFDAIACNPPFFEETLLPPDAGRAAARHTTSLPFQELVTISAQLLCDGGRFCVVLPTTAFDAFRLLCFREGLFLVARCDVQTSPRKAPKRTLACFTKGSKTSPAQTTTTQLILMENGHRSSDYTALTRDFYLA